MTFWSSLYWSFAWILCSVLSRLTWLLFICNQFRSICLGFSSLYFSLYVSLSSQCFFSLFLCLSSLSFYPFSPFLFAAASLCFAVLAVFSWIKFQTAAAPAWLLLFPEAWSKKEKKKNFSKKIVVSKKMSWWKKCCYHSLLPPRWFVVATTFVSTHFTWLAEWGNLRVEQQKNNQSTIR